MASDFVGDAMRKLADDIDRAYLEGALTIREPFKYPTLNHKPPRPSVRLTSPWGAWCQVELVAGDVKIVSHSPDALAGAIFKTERGAEWWSDNKCVASGIWDYYGTTPPAPEPQPQSPQDKALDDFIAKRKAKRDDARAREFDEQMERNREKFNRDADALGNAMSKLAPHHHDMHTRVMPYRVQQ